MLGAINGIEHGFFGREGGVSEGLYASLNCGYGTSDDRASIGTNRARVADTLGIRPAHLLTVYQTHSAEVVRVEVPWAPEDAPRADALVTNARGFGLAILAADCAPVLFADAAAGVIGAAHAGWKGAFGGVLEATISAMEKLGADRQRIIAAIGPAISQSNYEVGPEFLERFRGAGEGNRRHFAPAPREGHALFDLPGYIRVRLNAAGLEQIGAAGACTYSAETRYFSFRRATHRQEPAYGRNISVIALRGGHRP